MTSGRRFLGQQKINKNKVERPTSFRWPNLNGGTSITASARATHNAKLSRLWTP